MNLFMNIIIVTVVLPRMNQEKRRIETVWTTLHINSGRILYIISCILTYKIVPAALFKYDMRKQYCLSSGSIGILVEYPTVLYW